MTIKSEAQTGRFDTVKWLLVVILIAAGVVFNFYYSHIAWALRLAAWIILICVLIGIMAQTVKGQQAWAFAKVSRAELRKVVWPTRPETIQTTLVVVVLVIIMALLMWGIDAILMWIVGLLTGQRG